MAFNSLVLVCSLCSLRRQQRAQREETMQGLCSPKAGDGPQGQPPARRDKPERRSPERNPREHAAAVPVPESIGRSMETLAGAVARTGNAIELAITAKGTAGTEQKMK